VQKTRAKNSHAWAPLTQENTNPKTNSSYDFRWLAGCRGSWLFQVSWDCGQPKLGRSAAKVWGNRWIPGWASHSQVNVYKVSMLVQELKYRWQNKSKRDKENCTETANFEFWIMPKLLKL
jgi:hypothetical protein